MVFRWSLSESKSPQVSKTLLSVLVDVNNIIIWMISFCPLISKSPSLIIYPLVTITRAPITIGITVTFMFIVFSVCNTMEYYHSKITTGDSVIRKTKKVFTQTIYSLAVPHNHKERGKLSLGLLANLACSNNEVPPHPDRFSSTSNSTCLCRYQIQLPLIQNCTFHT